VGYSLRQIDGAWKIYDVSVEGISLAVNYRTIFGQEIITHGMDGLIANLVSRNAAGKCVTQSTAATATSPC
jgi:phospholipid transport system substrate-binding protein